MNMIQSTTLDLTQKGLFTMKRKHSHRPQTKKLENNVRPAYEFVTPEYWLNQVQAKAGKSEPLVDEQAEQEQVCSETTMTDFTRLAIKLAEQLTVANRALSLILKLVDTTPVKNMEMEPVFDFDYSDDDLDERTD